MNDVQFAGEWVRTRYPVGKPVVEVVPIRLP